MRRFRLLLIAAMLVIGGANASALPEGTSIDEFIATF